MVIQKLKKLTLADWLTIIVAVVIAALAIVGSSVYRYHQDHLYKSNTTTKIPVKSQSESDNGA
jgi:flagellar basal body-associated protein FliL